MFDGSEDEDEDDLIQCTNDDADILSECEDIELKDYCENGTMYHNLPNEDHALTFQHNPITMFQF
jgi:hypothetical protein